MLNRKFNALPGFNITMGFTLFSLSAIVLIPMAALFLKTSELSFTWPPHESSNVPNFWRVISTERAIASYRLTFGASLVAAFVNAVFGTILAWVLVRYRFPGRRFIDGLVDFPFALPTAVAGLTLANLLADNGWIGRYLSVWNESGAREVWAQKYDAAFHYLAGIPVLKSVAALILPAHASFEIHGAFTRLGVIIALTFVGMPFAVRTLQPVLEGLDRSMEEAAASLGAGRWRTFTRVIGPSLAPTIITGFALSFARAVGEYCSIVFISGNKAFETEIAPQLIVFKLEEYDYLGATAIAAVLLVISFIILIGINYLEAWASRFTK